MSRSMANTLSSSRKALAVGSRYLSAIGVSALATAIAYPLYPHFDPVNIVMVYVLGTALAALRLGRGPSALSAVVGVGAFDFFFVPPRYSFYVSEAQYFFTMGTMLGVALVIANLMASVRRQAELAANARLAAERATLRNTLLAAISHDLRAPLSAIAGAGSLVAQTHDALGRQRRVTLGQLIEHKARDMSELLGKVLELMRLESVGEPENGQWQSLSELVGTAVRYTLHRLDRWRVVTHIPGDFPMLWVDGRLMVQLFANLLENSAKYTPPGTSISIGAAVRKEKALLIVEDNGPGFGTQDPELLFAKFERGPRESVSDGVGLGLAICRAIVTVHGGYIRAMNRPAGGARFEITLPLASAPVAEQLAYS